MIVQYDYQIFCNQPYGGISRYFYELIKGIESRALATVQLDVYLANNEYLPLLPGHGHFNNNLEFKGKKDAVKLFNKLYDQWIASRRSFDVFHSTYYDTTCLQSRKGKPHVVTMHDLIDEKFHANDPAFQQLISNRKQMCEAADAIIAVSHNTKKDVVELMGIDAAKIHVIHHGNSLTQTVQRFSTPAPHHKPYLLYVGKRHQYKNFTTFIKAAAPVFLRVTDIAIICAGGGSFNNTETTLFAELGINNRIHYQPINGDASLIPLYNNALAFVYPSLYEGFGFPIIEAFTCSCPVLVSNASCLPEVAGSAALYFDPHQPEQITNCIEQVINSQQLQDELIQKGLLQAAQFTWNKAVDKTLPVYRSLL